MIDTIIKTVLTNSIIGIANVEKTIDILDSIGLSIDSDLKSPDTIGSHLYKTTGSLYDIITDIMGVKHDSNQMDDVMNTLMDYISDYNKDKVTLDEIIKYIMSVKVANE